MRHSLDEMELTAWAETRKRGERAFVFDDLLKRRLPVTLAISLLVSWRSERLGTGVIVFVASAAVGIFLSVTYARAEWSRQEERFREWRQ